MSETSLNHPGDEALRALSLGQLSEAEMAHVSTHLADCPACCRRIDQLTTDDRLLARLQQNAASREEVLVSPAQRRPAVRALRRSKEDSHATRKPDPEATGESDPVVRPSSAARPQKSEMGDRYQLFGEIARGGMGAVLRGRDVDLGRDLAVKVLLEKHADRPEVARRFVEEAQIGGQLQHPGIVPVYDIGRFGDRPFFTMKLVKGQTLAAFWTNANEPTDGPAASPEHRLAGGADAGLCPRKGVIHRDLKPANIMVGAFGEVQVMDWGLAKVLAEGGVADEERARPAA